MNLEAWMMDPETGEVSSSKVAAELVAVALTLLHQRSAERAQDAKSPKERAQNLMLVEAIRSLQTALHGGNLIIGGKRIVVQPGDASVTH